MTTFDEITVSRMAFVPRQIPALPEFPLALTVHASGETRYEAHTNAWGVEPEIGRYRHEFSGERLARVGDVVGALELDGLAAGLQSILATYQVRVHIRARGSDVSLMFVPEIQREQLLQSLVNESDALARELRPHAEWTVRVETSDLHRDASLVTLAARMSNRGTSAIGVRTPSGATGAEAPFDVWFSERGDNGEFRSREVSLEAVELLAPADRTRRVLALRPGAALDVRVRVRLPSERGGELRLEYINEQAREGELEMAVGYVSTRAMRVPDAAP